MSTYSRVKTWSSNETLTSSDLNAEFNNIITNTNSGGLNSDNVSTSAAWTWTGTHTMSTSSKLAFIDNIYLTMGSATDGDYLLRYSASSTALELSTTNSDGSGTNAVVVDIQDGTDDVRVRGGLSTNNATAPTTGIKTGGPVLSDTTNTDALGSTSVTWSDLYLGDSAVLAFGEDQDVTLTHDPDDGIFINAGMKLAFRDMGGEYIYSVSDGTLGIAAATEVDITTTTLDVNGVLEVSGNASVGGTLGVTGVGTFTAQSVHTGGIQSGSDIVSDTDSTDDLGTTSVRWANVYADSVGDTGQALAITAGTNAINLTGGDLTLFDDNNNADVSLSLGTSATEALVVQALNGGSNKTLEELRFTTKTASGTGDHGKMSFYVDETEIATIDDGGIDLASGLSFTVAGSAIGGTVAADDITTGNAAVNIITTTGNITLDAQANDADVVFKVDDGGSAVTALTLDGSDEGNAIFVNDLQLKSDSAVLEFGADLDTTLTHTDGTGLTLNSTNKLTFGDTASFVQQSADGTLRIDGEAIIDLNASTRVDVSGDLKVGGEVQTANIGYTDGDNAITIADGGGCTFPQAAAFSGDVSMDGGSFVFNETGADKDFRIEGDSVANLFFADASTDRIGIGTATPAGALEVIVTPGNPVRITDPSGSVNASEASLGFYGSTDGATRLGYLGIASTANSEFRIVNSQNDDMWFGTNNTEAMRINSEGVVGIKTTPLAGWHTDHGVLQIGTGAFWVDPHDETAASNMVFLSNNLYRDSSDEWRYIVTDEASRYYQYAGEHYFDTAASGSAGAAISFANRLKIPITSPVEVKASNTTTDDILRLTQSSTGDAKIMYHLDGVMSWQAGIDNSDSDSFVITSDSGNGIKITTGGALSKSSGSFRIEHPLPEKSNTHDLVHSFIEGPQADLIYSGVTELSDGVATLNIDTEAAMTEGTFDALNRCVRVFTSNESNWDAVRGSITGNILTIESNVADSSASVSWMVIGERQDTHMHETDWTDDDGKVIVEPESA